MFGKHVKITSTKRAVPKLELREYEIEVRTGKEFIIDGYGGAVPVKQLEECEVTFERL